MKLSPVHILSYEMKSALGTDTQAHAEGLQRGSTALAMESYADAHFAVGRILPKESIFSCVDWSVECGRSALTQAGMKPHDRMGLFIASTKGDIDTLLAGNQNASLTRLGEAVRSHLAFSRMPIIISHACSSGVIALISAMRFIQTRVLDEALVIGVDQASEFVVNGFRSLMAVDSQPCRPFDSMRNGVSLGDGASAILLSNRQGKVPVALLTGAVSNDANHISGPSRDGSGLIMSIEQTMRMAGYPTIDQVCAHGTATLYNDEMEAKAFHALHLDQTPTYSLKGYWGHTLGASGVLEVAATALAMEHQCVWATAGYQSCGVSAPLSITGACRHRSTKVALKTSSGFGGINASLLLTYCP